MSIRTGNSKVQYVCQECGCISLKWLGRCPDCGTWNQMIEEVKSLEIGRKSSQARIPGEAPISLAGVSIKPARRYSTGLGELDRVMGGGVVPGSLILVGGDPGIGKSTLLLQTAIRLAQGGLRVLYVSGEESGSQIKLRADRLGGSPPELFLLCESRIEEIQEASRKLQPAVIIIDSIQTMIHPGVSSVPGSVSQVRESGGALLSLAKSAGGPSIFLVGHVTKEGLLAGPRVLEHIVDTVLYFEGDGQHGFRILRAVKNRFGSTNEVGLFEMGAEGLTEVHDPSGLFIQERQKEGGGSAIAVSLEGSRPLLMEIQSLVSRSYFGVPQRRVSGLDYNRTCLMLAVLERRAGLILGTQDVFVSVAGGLAVYEPAVDLAAAVAIASSLKDETIDHETVVFGELGLGGEIRAVTQPERRIREAVRMGFKRAVLPQRNLTQIKSRPKEFELTGVNNLQAALEALLSYKQKRQES